MATPPIPPSGVNPYTFYLNVIDQIFYEIPTEGFKIRLGVLFALNGSAILLGLIYLGILIFETRRNQTSQGGRKKLWLFKLVQRPSGRYIATNQTLWSTIMTIISSVIILMHVRDGYIVYIQHGSYQLSASWRSLSFLPLFIHGYIVSFAILQAFTLTPDQHDNKFFTATIANVIFVGLGIGLFVGMLTTAILATLSGNSVWRLSIVVQEKLRISEANWDGKNLNPGDFFKLITLLVPLSDAGNAYAVELYNQTAFLCIVPLISAGINLASLGLARVLQKQINLNYEQFRKFSLPDSNNGEQSNSTTIGQVSMSEDFSHDSKKGSSRRDSNQPSRRQIRAIAKNEMNGLESEQAKKIMVLQKAERDLLLISSFLLLVLIGASVLLVWITLNLRNGGQSILTNWTYTEVALFGCEWIYGITANIALSALIYNAYTHLSTPPTVPESSIKYSTHLATRSIVSLQEMFTVAGDLEADLYTGNRRERNMDENRSQIGPLDSIPGRDMEEIKELEEKEK